MQVCHLSTNSTDYRSFYLRRSFIKLKELIYLLSCAIVVFCA